MNDSKLKVGIYLRLSDEDKDKINKLDPSESIKNQRNMLIDYINKHPLFVLVDEYSDEDLSGAGTYRPEFERLIKDCKNKKIDVVLCKSQSRFSRDMEIVEKYINNKFKEWNIRFISLSDNADTENIGNKKSRQINGLVNEWYLEDVSNNIRDAFKIKMKHGEFISPFASYGYVISSTDNNKLIIDEYASIIVKKIYNLYLKGLGYTKIAKYLNSKNIPSPSLYKYKKGIKMNVVSNKHREDILWNPNAIKTILTNEVYIGNLVQGKRTTISYKNHKIINKPKSDWIRIENTHKPIISPEIFKKVQVAIKERTKPINKTGIVHNFSGKVFCLECNNIMRKKNSSKHEYLVCKNSQGELNKCNNKTSIRYDDLENIILKEINKKIKKYYDETLIKKELSKTINNKYNNKLKLLEKEKKDYISNLSKINNYLQNLYEDKVNGVINIEQFKKILKKYNNDEIQLKNRINSINKDIKYIKSKNLSIKNINEKFKYKKLNRIIIEEYINKIFISKIDKNTNSREIKIIWNL